MQVETFTEERKLALAKWREYRSAIKRTDDPVYKDLAKVYNQIKMGRKVIDIQKALQKGGLHPDTGHPRLAVAIGRAVAANP